MIQLTRDSTHSCVAVETLAIQGLRFEIRNSVPLRVGQGRSLERGPQCFFWGWGSSWGIVCHQKGVFQHEIPNLGKSARGQLLRKTLSVHTLREKRCHQQIPAWSAPKRQVLAPPNQSHTTIMTGKCSSKPRAPKTQRYKMYRERKRDKEKERCPCPWSLQCCRLAVFLWKFPASSPTCYRSLSGPKCPGSVPESVRTVFLCPSSLCSF